MEDIVKMLLDRGASCEDTDRSGSTAIHKFAETGAVNVLRIFAEREIDLDPQDDDGATPLMYAIKNARHAAAQFLVDRGANVNAQASVNARIALRPCVLLAKYWLIATSFPSYWIKALTMRFVERMIRQRSTSPLRLVRRIA